MDVSEKIEYYKASSKMLNNIDHSVEIDCFQWLCDNNGKLLSRQLEELKLKYSIQEIALETIKNQTFNIVNFTIHTSSWLNNICYTISALTIIVIIVTVIIYIIRRKRICFTWCCETF